MKTVEDLNEAFCSGIQACSLVRVTLLRGFEVEYDKRSGEARIVLPEKVTMGMLPQSLVGLFTEYSDLGGSGKGSIELEGAGDGEYYATVNCNQIDDFEVLS
ncbi:MAG: hypothetical protein KKB21_00175 [Nanoarchaeota archaeon]|nr:hypothetical protein [Nanoarchaeota archaeon]MBU4085975.1 hypothetical protein [Nanoarchaeota archaeon]